MNISAIDLGFKYLKAVINGKTILIKSVVGNSKPLRFADMNMGLKEGDHLQSRIGTENFFVSDLAVEQSDVVLHSLKDDRFDSEATNALIKTAFALGYGNNNSVESLIVSGLPVSHYHKYKESIKDLFLDKIHNYEVKENSILLRGSVKATNGLFIPQPFGALMDRILDNEGKIADSELAGKTVAVIDIGFGTGDIYVVNSLSPVERLTFSTKTAMNHAYGLISDKIEEKFDVRLALYAVESVVRSGEFRKNGNSYNIKPLIEWANKATSQQLVSEITNKWKTIHEIDQILLAGGGGEALSSHILPEFKNIELLDNSQFAVVNGYYKWGVRNYGKTV